jgi:hypothetical protein
MHIDAGKAVRFMVMLKEEVFGRERTELEAFNISYG